MSEELDQPVEAETPAGVEADAPEVEEAEVETALDEDGNPIEEAPETEEFEHDGKKYALPKDLKPLLMMQKDYTQKTQEVATQRQELAARATEMAQQAETQATTIQERATLVSVDASLAQFQAINWQDYVQQFGQEAAITAQGQWRQLEAAKSQLQTEIDRKETEHRSQREQTTANALREADQVLAREVKGYSPEFVKAVSDTASTFGFTPLELRDSLIGPDGKPDVRSFKVLAELKDLREFKAKYETKTKTAQTTEKQAAVIPAKTVGQRSGGYQPGLNDRLPIEEWTRRRNAEVAKAKAEGRR